MKKLLPLFLLFTAQTPSCIPVCFGETGGSKDLTQKELRIGFLVILCVGLILGYASRLLFDSQPEVKITWHKSNIEV